MRVPQIAVADCTVVIPTYNERENIATLLPAVLAHPRMRVLVVDDAVSSGTTMVSGLRLLERCGAEIAAVAVAMRQGTQWQEKLRRADGTPIPVVGAYDCPRLVRRADGWWPEEL